MVGHSVSGRFWSGDGVMYFSEQFRTDNIHCSDFCDRTKCDTHSQIARHLPPHTPSGNPQLSVIVTDEPTFLSTVFSTVNQRLLSPMLRSLSHSVCPWSVLFISALHALLAQISACVKGHSLSLYFIQNSSNVEANAYQGKRELNGIVDVGVSDQKGEEGASGIYCSPQVVKVSW